MDLFIQAEAARNPLEIRIYINLLSQQETGGDRHRPPLLAAGTACATHLYEKTPRTWYRYHTIPAHAPSEYLRGRIIGYLTVNVKKYAGYAAG